MKIILADSHGPVMGKDQTSANLSLLYLAGYIRSKVDFEVKFEYIPQAKSDSFHLQRVEVFQPQIYAVSFTSYSALITYELIRKVKKRNPSVLVVCGGPHVTHVPKGSFRKSWS